MIPIWGIQMTYLVRWLSLTSPTGCGSLYVALSLRTSFRMVTADKKLYNSLKKTTFRKYILGVEDIPS